MWLTKTAEIPSENQFLVSQDPNFFSKFFCFSSCPENDILQHWSQKGPFEFSCSKSTDATAWALMISGDWTGWGGDSCCWVVIHLLVVHD